MQKPRSRYLCLFLLNLVLSSDCRSVLAIELAPAILNSENIACYAMNIAESTRTTGRCYAAVSQALKPLGVELTGASAFMAQPLLLNDSRFCPVPINDVSELMRGDIIVFSSSVLHPHGHISVYQGNMIEASDHISPVTHTREYGTATVFRLRNTLVANQSGATSRSLPLIGQERQSQSKGLPPMILPYQSAEILKKRTLRNFARKCIRFLMQ